MADKISETKQLIEANATGAPVKDVLWNANQLEVDPIRMEDPGQGAPVVLRHFFFKASPNAKKPTKRELFEEQKRVIETTLWGDGLRPIMDKRIEVHTIKGVKKLSKTLYAVMKTSKFDYVIQVLCEPARGHVWSSNNPDPVRL